MKSRRVKKKETDYISVSINNEKSTGMFEHRSEKKRRNELTFTSTSSRASTTEEQLPYFKSEKKTLEIAIQHESVYCKR